MKALRLGLRKLTGKGVSMLGYKTAMRWLFAEIRTDQRMQISIGLGLILSPASIWLFRHLVARGFDKFLLNVEISLMTSVIWYIINRQLFADAQAKTSRTVGGSFAWWLLSFGLHQATFVTAVSIVGLPYFLVKGVQVSLEPPEFFAKYWFNKNKLFVNKTVKT